MYGQHPMMYQPYQPHPQQTGEWDGLVQPLLMGSSSGVVRGGVS